MSVSSIILQTGNGMLTNTGYANSVITEINGARKKQGVPGDKRLEQILRALGVTDPIIIEEICIRKDECFSEGGKGLPKSICLAKLKVDLKDMPQVNLVGVKELSEVLDAW